MSGRAGGQEVGSTHAISICPGLVWLAGDTMTDGLEGCLPSALASLHCGTNFLEGTLVMGQKLDQDPAILKRGSGICDTGELNHSVVYCSENLHRTSNEPWEVHLVSDNVFIQQNAA